LKCYHYIYVYKTDKYYNIYRFLKLGKEEEKLCYQWWRDINGDRKERGVFEKNGNDVGKLLIE
jgi:hypothetical protein